MVSKLVLLLNLLLVSGSSAVPSSRLESRLARRRENRQSQTFNHVEPPDGAASDVEYSPNWAGAAWSEVAGTFTKITGTFTIPTPSGNDGAAAAWVGIDGYNCQNAILQTGVDFTINGGEVSYDAWYEWYPDLSYDFTGIDLRAGDVITATVVAHSTRRGVATIENKTTGQTVRQHLSSTYALCETDAEWIVEDFQFANGTQVPFADFGTVIFTDATATGPGGNSYTPSGAGIIDIEQNRKVLTSVSIHGGAVTIKYV